MSNKCDKVIKQEQIMFTVQCFLDISTADLYTLFVSLRLAAVDGGKLITADRPGRPSQGGF